MRERPFFFFAKKAEGKETELKDRTFLKRKVFDGSSCTPADKYPAEILCSADRWLPKGRKFDDDL